MLPLQQHAPSERLPSLLPSDEINYAALSRAPETVKVFSHGLMDRGCFRLPVILPIWSKEEKHGTQSRNSC